jgi:hypothetical protein
MSRTTSKNPDEMTEAELADYYYTHRDDLAGEEVPSPVPKRLDVMLSVRFSAAEAAEIRAAAQRARMSVSAFLRQQALASTSNVVDLARVRADLEDMRAKAADALQALTDNPVPRSPA